MSSAFYKLGQPERWRLTLELRTQKSWKTCPRIDCYCQSWNSNSVLSFSKVHTRSSCALRIENRKEDESLMMIHRFHSPFSPHSTNPSKTLHKAFQLLKVSRMTQPKTCVFSRTDLQSLTFISNPYSPVLLFSIAAVTNYHKHSGLKLCQLIILHFGRSEVWSGSQWVEIKVSEGHCFSGGFRGQSVLAFSSF